MWRRQLGPTTVGVLVLALTACWAAARPTGQDSASYAGQYVGALSVLLISIGLVLISTLPWVEDWFDGIDRAAIWHRRLEIAGLLLIVPHILLAANPHGTTLGAPLGVAGAIGMGLLALWAILPRWRSITPRRALPVLARLREHSWAGWLHDRLGGYDRWRMVHRTSGLFLAFAFAHGLLDATPFTSATLRWSYVGIGGTGLAFYAYRELVARHLRVLHDYHVAEVRRVSSDLVEIALEPLGRPMRYTPGQFAMLYLEARDGWHRHPFTIAGSPDDGRLRFTVKGLGDYTSRIEDLVEPGMPAVVGGPHGRFDHAKASGRQVWIAGGVGVTPFLSWLRSLDGHPPRGPVDFFYTSATARPPYADEIEALAAGRDGVRAHLVDTSAGPRLSADAVISRTDADPRRLSVFLCGPNAMVQSLRAGFRQAGVPAHRIHHEHFDWR